nr:EpsG family protein [Providencia rettgeri]
MALLLTFIAGFRSIDTGFDYQQYVSFITFIESSNNIFDLMTNNLRFEPIFLLSSYTITKILSFEFVFVFLFYSIMGVFFKAIAFNKLSPLPVISLLLYFQAQYFYGDFAQIRQSVAMTFFLFSVYYLWKKRHFPSIIFLLLASFSHYSAVFCFIIYPLSFIFTKTRKKTLLSSLFILLLLSIVFSFIQLKTSSFLSQIVPFELLSSKIVSYSKSEYSDAIDFGISDIIRITTCILIYFIIIKKDKKDIFIFSYLYIVGCIIFFLLKNDGILASRITSYFKILDCIILPQIIYEILLNKKIKKFMLNFVIITTLLSIYSITSFYKNVIITPEIYNYEMSY